MFVFLRFWDVTKAYIYTDSRRTHTHTPGRMIHQIDIRSWDLYGLLHCLRLHKDSVSMRTLPLKHVLPGGHNDRSEEVVVVQGTV